MKHIGRKLLVPAVGIALAGGSFAFLASNNVGASAAGEGQNNIAGYNVQNIHYTTAYGSTYSNTTGSTNNCVSSDNQYASSDNSDTCITAVSFTLDLPAQPSNVRAVINSGGSGFSHNHIYGQCAQNSANGVWTCTTTDPSGDAVYGGGITANTLEVMAAS